jgi:hypothetical protein
MGTNNSSWANEYRDEMVDAVREAADMTATEVRLRQQVTDAYRQAFIAEFVPKKAKIRSDWEAEQYAKWETQLDKKLSTARDAMDQELAATPMKRADHPPIDIAAIHRVHHLMRQRNLDPKRLSLTIPAGDFLGMFIGNTKSRRDGECYGSTMRVCDIEILRGTDDVIAWLNAVKMVESDREALRVEIYRCLGRDAIGELPKSASSNGVSPSAKTVGEIAVAASPASRDNRDSNRTADLSHEAKVIAAKHAIAVYAREKKLPGAEMLAAFGELDRAKASGGAAAVGVDLRPGALNWVPASWMGAKWVEATPANINRHAHRLSSESLRRAADQIWIGNSGGTYADLVCSRPERLAEMVYRGDAAADGERG